MIDTRKRGSCVTIGRPGAFLFGGDMKEEARAVGWYGTSEHSPVVRHWDGTVWSPPVPRKEFGPGVVIYIDSTSGRSDTPHQATVADAARKKAEIGCGTGCLMVILAIVGVGFLISWITTPFLASNNPRFTEESGLETCKELVSRRDGGSGSTTVQGSVLQGDMYKATIAVAGFSKANRFTCRLEWTGEKWSTDVLEGHEL